MKALLFATLSLGLVGCLGDSDLVSQDETTLTFETGDFDVPAGDFFECFWTDTFTDRELAVVNAWGKQQQGGHHITVYYTDEPKDPQHHACVDAEMAEWHMIGGAVDSSSATAEDALKLPPGLGLKVPEGKQLVVQSHYINLSGGTITTNDEITLDLGPASELSGFVNQFLVFDGEFMVPPHESSESVTTCTVPQDLNIVLMLGHLHEWGSFYSLEQIDDQGVTQEMLYEEEWYPSYASAPPVNRFTMDEPLVLKAGTRLRQTCRWDNVEDYALRFPREMCLAFNLYFPDDGEIECVHDR